MQNNITKKLMKQIIKIISIAFVIMYLIVSFVQAEINCFNWTNEQRASVIVLTVFSIIIFFLVEKINKI